MDKKLLLSVVLSTTFIFGFGSKDADYYFEHPEEIKKVGTECRDKMMRAITDVGVDPMHIPDVKDFKTDEQFAEFKQKMEQVIDNLKELKNNKECQEVMIAASAVRKNNLKLAKMQDSDLWVKQMEDIIKDLKMGLTKIEEQYQQEKNNNDLQKQKEN